MLRQLARLALNHLGYDVRRVASPASVHVPEAGADPITFEYMPQRRGHAVFEIPVEDARAFQSLALPLTPQCHPFVLAFRSALWEQGDEAARSSIEGILRAYYERVCPTSAAEVLGVSAEEAPGLGGVGPHSQLLPWTGTSLGEEIQRFQRIARFEGLQNGFVTHVRDGLTSFGPVRPAKLTLEVARLYRLVASVKSRGFIRFDRRSPLEVAAIRSGNQYKWVINSGQHRFAMAAALEIGSVPAIVTEVIRREDAAHWPQVVSGVFSERGALSVFDRMFDGSPAPVCETWIRSLDARRDSNVAD